MNKIKYAGGFIMIMFLMFSGKTQAQKNSNLFAGFRRI